MLVLNKSNMVVIEATSGAELQARYNAEMDKLTADGIKIDDKIISLEKMSVIILYSQKVRIPQNLKDEFTMAGIYPQCQDCPHYDAFGDGNGWCDRLTKNSLSLRDDTDICNWRWMELERELGRRKYVTKPESRNDAPGSDEREAC